MLVVIDNPGVCVAKLVNAPVFKTGIRGRICGFDSRHRHHRNQQGKTMSPKDKVNMKKLVEQRDKLLKEMEALRHKIEGLEMAISLVGGQTDEASILRSGGKRRSNVKGLIISLLTEAGISGLNASSAVERADRKGVILDRASASSILSRMKADDIVIYDGQNYRLKEFSNSIEDLI